MSTKPPKITPIPVIPGGGGGGGGGPAPCPGVNYEALLYRLLFPYYTPGGLQGQNNYFTLLTANMQWAANTYQRLFGDQTYTQRFASLFIVINLSSDSLTLSWGQGGSPPSNNTALQAHVLGPYGSGNHVGVFPASDMGQMWILGPNKGDAYNVEWYTPSGAVIPT